MNCINANRWWCVTLMLLGSTLVLADGWTSGGGNAQKQGQNYYLFDFVEGGIEDSATYLPGVEDKMHARSIVRASLPLSVSNEVVGIVTAKLNEISDHIPQLAEILFDTFKKYQWRSLNASLVPIFDIGKSPIKEVKGLELYQLAVRDDTLKLVSIHRNLYVKLATVHQAGLIFHEIFYALLVGSQGAEDSYETRSLSAYFFSPSFAMQSFEQITARLDRAKLQAPNGLWVSPEQMNWVKSPEFQTECQRFKNESFSTIQKSLTTFGEFYKDVYDDLQDIQSKNKFTGFDKSLGQVGKIQFFGQKDWFYYPMMSSIPSQIHYSTHRFIDYFRFDGGEHSYYINEKDLKRIRLAQNEIVPIVKSDRGRFLQACFTPEERSALDYFVKLDANPNRSVD